MKISNKTILLFYKIASLFCVIPGFIHTILTPYYYPVMNDDWFWFSAAGLSLVFSGLLNYFAIWANKRLMFGICIVINLIMIVWTLLLIIYTNHSVYWLLIIYLLTLKGSAYFFLTKGVKQKNNISIVK